MAKMTLGQLLPPIDKPKTESKQKTAPSIVPLTIQVTPEDRDRIHQLKLDTKMSIQEMGHEAWNDYLAKRGLSPMEWVTASVRSGRDRG